MHATTIAGEMWNLRRALMLHEYRRARSLKRSLRNPNGGGELSAAADRLQKPLALRPELGEGGREALVARRRQREMHHPSVDGRGNARDQSGFLGPLHE